MADEALWVYHLALSEYAHLPEEYMSAQKGNTDSANGSPNGRPTPRSVLSGTAAAAGAAAMAGIVSPAAFGADDPSSAPAERKGRIPQSVCKWCYPKVSVEQL